jgi:putative oxidoreductase
MTISDRMTQWQRSATAGGWALLLLRLMVGYGFANHGYAKLSRGVDGFAGVLGAMGIPAPGLAAWATTLIEFVGGILMMLGAFVVPLTIPFTIIMLTAMFGVHLRYGFSAVKLKAITATGAEFGPTGYELNLLYISAFVTLALSTSSALSLDRWFAGRRKHTAPAPIQV